MTNDVADWHRQGIAGEDGGEGAGVPARRAGRGYWGAVLRRLCRDRLTMACLVILVVIVLCAIFAPYLAPDDPFRTRMPQRLLPVGTPGFPLGTDELGRDMLSRLLHGARQSLTMGILPVFNALLIGGFCGMLAGFFGGWANMLIMRVIDVFYAFPSVLLAVAIAGTLGTGFTNVVVALTVVFIPPIARIAESVTTQVRKMDFVEAARATGAGSLSILRVHVLNNVLGPITTYATSLISVSIIVASGLSFLGLGVKPPVPEWGSMLNTLMPAIYTTPWVAAAPGAMIFVTSICCNLASDGLRAAMDERT